MADESRESLEAVRQEKLKGIAALGLDPWGQRFDGHTAVADARLFEVPEGAGSNGVVGPTVRVAGRIMLRRGQGKVNFLQVRDWTGAIQIFVGKNQVGEAGWELAGLLDLGDLVGVDGALGYTKTGELTVFATALTILGKSLLPPPEKWHGLTDVEQRSRQRYVDLFSNPESLAHVPGPLADRRRVPARCWAIAGSSRSRRPRMQAIAGGAAARPFVTHHNALDIRFVHEDRPGIVSEAPARRRHGARVRDWGGSIAMRGSARKHNPEFTMLEAYQAYSDYHGMMDLTEALDLSPRSRPSTASTSAPGARRRSTSPPPGRARPIADLIREHAGVRYGRRGRRCGRSAESSGPGHGRQGTPTWFCQRGVREDGRGQAGRPRLRHRLPGRHLPA